MMDVQDPDHSIQNSSYRQRLQSYHEQSINVMNAMLTTSREPLAAYNDDDNATSHGQGSMKGAVFILMNSIMGASILVLPYTFGQIGLVSAVMMQLFVVFLSHVTHMVLADAVDLYDGSNYQTLVGKACGPLIQALSQIGLILYTFSLSASTHITIGDQAVKLCDAATGEDNHWYCKRYFMIPTVSFTLIFPLIWVRNISSFSYTSYLSALAVLYIVVAVIADYFILDLPMSDEILMPDVSGLTVLQYFPIMALGMCCHMTSVPLYYELNGRTTARFSIVVLCANSMVLFFYLGFGTFGLLTFGVNVQPDILLSYSPSDTLMMIARGAISVSVIASYPIFLFLGRNAIEDTLVQLGNLCSQNVTPNNELRRIFVTLCWHLSALSISLLTSSLAVVLAYVGSIAALFMLFFPGYILWNGISIRNWAHRITAVILMALGTFTFLWTVVFNSYKEATTKVQ